MVAHRVNLSLCGAPRARTPWNTGGQEPSKGESRVLEPMKASAAGGPPHKRAGSGARTGGALNGVEQGGFAGASQPLGWVAPYLGRMYCTVAVA